MTPDIRDALRPFAEACEGKDVYLDGDMTCVTFADLRRAAAAYQTLVEEGEVWQPIETAPKDGTKFLAGRFVDQCREGRNGFIAVDRWRARERGDEYTGLGKFNERFWPATHWRPLPAPPTALSRYRQATTGEGND